MRRMKNHIETLVGCLCFIGIGVLLALGV